MSRFVERSMTTGRVDREAGVIHGVKLLGGHSRNNREYTSDAMQNAVPLYDGVKVFVNHPTRDRLGEDRSFHDWVGVIRSPRFERGGIFGDIHLRQKSPLYEEIIEAAELHSGNFGMSHIADGDSRMRDGIDVVEIIARVDSVDIVLEPATAAGLFESYDIDGGGFDNASTSQRILGELVSLAAKHPELQIEQSGLLATATEAVAVLVAIEMKKSGRVGESYRPPSPAAMDYEPLRPSDNPFAPAAFTDDEMRRYANRLR